MASLQQVIEKLALLAAAGSNATAGANATSSVASATLGPLATLPSIAKMLFSASALREWAVLLVLGSLFETSRRLLASLWNWLINSFFITAVFDDEDPSFRAPRLAVVA
jgi:chaperone BCS1